MLLSITCSTVPKYLRFTNCYGKANKENHALTESHMIKNRSFESEQIQNSFYLEADIYEIPLVRFITKPPACWGKDILIEIYHLLLLFIIISPCYNICIEDVRFTRNLFFIKGFNVKECYYPLHVVQSILQSRGVV